MKKLFLLNILFSFLSYSTVVNAQNLNQENNKDSLQNLLCSCLVKPINQISREERLDKIDKLLEAGASLNRYCEVIETKNYKGNGGILGKAVTFFVKPFNSNARYETENRQTIIRHYQPIFFFRTDTVMIENLVKRGADINANLSKVQGEFRKKIAQIYFDRGDVKKLKFCRRIGADFKYLHINTESINAIDFVLANGGQVVVGRHSNRDIPMKANSTTYILGLKNYQTIISRYNIDINKFRLRNIRKIFYRSIEEAEWMLDNGLDKSSYVFKSILEVFFKSSSPMNFLPYNRYFESRYTNPLDNPKENKNYKKEELKAIKWLNMFERKEVNLNICFYESTPLQKVISYQSLSIIKKMLDMGVDPNFSCKTNNKSALDSAKEELNRLENSYPNAIHYIKQAREIVDYLNNP